MIENNLLQPFEVEASGFTGDGMSDERVLWIAAPDLESALKAIEGMDATLTPLTDFDFKNISSDIDYTLPEELDVLRTILNHFKDNRPEEEGQQD
jgi:hypothetical protein